MRGFLILLVAVLVAIGLGIAGVAAAGSKGPSKGAASAARPTTVLVRAALLRPAPADTPTTSVA